jgi:leucyl/phenylalanyl-tRNA--protein transferase
MASARPTLPWLEASDPLPPPSQAWGAGSAAPGLLAAGGDLSVHRLLQAYAQGCFPWFSQGQPILWWSTDPRMVLRPEQFRLHRSLRKTLQKFNQQPGCEIRFDSAFERVISHCAAAHRSGQEGTWIVDAMIAAYLDLHRAGHAHSVETWVDGELVGGLYAVGIGAAVYGESMFALRSDASKIALAALVAWSLAQQVPLIDCQQNTPHLASMGAAEMPRSAFLSHLQHHCGLPERDWQFHPVYWKQLLKPSSPT